MQKYVDNILVDLTQAEIDALPKPPTPAEILATLATEARDKRNALLTASDYTQLADSPRDKQSWAVYRQALRDITGQVGFPETIVWPVAP